MPDGRDGPPGYQTLLLLPPPCHLAESLATRWSWLVAVSGKATRKAKPFNEHILIGANH